MVYKCYNKIILIFPNRFSPKIIVHSNNDPSMWMFCYKFTQIMIPACGLFLSRKAMVSCELIVNQQHHWHRPCWASIENLNTELIVGEVQRRFVWNRLVYFSKVYFHESPAGPWSKVEGTETENILCCKSRLFNNIGKFTRELIIACIYCNKEQCIPNFSRQVSWEHIIFYEFPEFR